MNSGTKAKIYFSDNKMCFNTNEEDCFFPQNSDGGVHLKECLRDVKSGQFSLMSEDDYMCPAAVSYVFTSVAIIQNVKPFTRAKKKEAFSVGGNTPKLTQMDN